MVAENWVERVLEGWRVNVRVIVLKLLFRDILTMVPTFIPH